MSRQYHKSKTEFRTKTSNSGDQRGWMAIFQIFQFHNFQFLVSKDWILFTLGQFPVYRIASTVFVRTYNVIFAIQCCCARCTYSSSILECDKGFIFNSTWMSYSHYAFTIPVGCKRTTYHWNQWPLASMVQSNTALSSQIPKQMHLKIVFTKYVSWIQHTYPDL